MSLGLKFRFQCWFGLSVACPGVRFTSERLREMAEWINNLSKVSAAIIRKNCINIKRKKVTTGGHIITDRFHFFNRRRDRSAITGDCLDMKRISPKGNVF